jgi:Kef-type K+ transport system membrane component KefB
MTVAALSIFVSSAITSLAELHPVLEAFIAGVYPADKIREMAAHRLEPPTSLILMPFFFFNAGLRTAFGDPNIWIVFGIATFMCIVGKTFGHGLAARAGGEPWAVFPRNRPVAAKQGLENHCAAAFRTITESPV